MILALEGISKKFGGLTALDDIDLGVEEGQIVGVIGPNGAGKSTLLNVIAGVYKPSSGSVRFQGRKISGLSPDRICQRGIGRTFQIPRPFPRMTVFENVLVSASFGNPDSSHNPEEFAQEILEFIKFPIPGSTPASNLNTALLRRLDLARALASRPKLLLLDECAAGLTPGELTEIQELVLQVRQQGVTVLIVEHLMSLIMEISDRILVLQYGVKIAAGTPDEIANDETVANAYLGEKYLNSSPG